MSQQFIVFGIVSLPPTAHVTYPGAADQGLPQQLKIAY
jgi:hypothetical protein